MVFCWYELCILYHIQDIPHLRFWLVTLTFQGRKRSNIPTCLKGGYAASYWFSVDTNSLISDHLRPWPSRVTEGQIVHFFGKPICDFNNGLLLIQTPYLVLLVRNSASKISVGDLDLSGSPKVKYFQLVWKADMRLCNGFLLIWTLYLVTFVRYSSSKILVSELDLSGSPMIKYFNFFGKLIWDFIISHTICEICEGGSVAEWFGFRTLDLKVEGSRPVCSVSG